jgi:hypothetical protein
VFFNTQKLVNMAGFALSFTKKFEKMWCASQNDFFLQIISSRLFWFLQENFILCGASHLLKPFCKTLSTFPIVYSFCSVPIQRPEGVLKKLSTRFEVSVSDLWVRNVRSRW